ncbi:MAG: radical SAM protein [Gemmataceae bacterium]|nr:radical SAM protein [Gemmataceae bacterium]
MTVAAITADRLAAADAHYRGCRLCEHRCGVDRTAGERGPCKAGPVARVFRQRVEYGDERLIAPSHLFYLSGCDLRCVFCINELNAFDPRRGDELTPELFRAAVEAGRPLQPRTLQWVGGEPTIHLPAVLAAMAGCPDLPRVVWKTDLHGTPEAYDLLDGVVDLYLADFKFGNNGCGRRIGGVERYTDILSRNLRLVAGRTDLIIRHLLLPGHTECCYRPIVTWLAGHLPTVKFSLREGYLPHWQANHYQELGRPLSRREIESARRIAADAGLHLVS